ncbi:molecular chaperone TorD [Vibrio sp. UCD-FRSSP16_10]|uniref:molecular chaperone TorD n=1 Tax=unclassified Vibrio TaxID=2614977 RepID=UPI000801B182|nr:MULTISPECIES: molecular chaperone TorD [unclassified Vibrio]OBT15943.1 molecular chaperone TorD [Vibrio sp. UCD-FRSSP16_10]OBT17837.1 molecular chaperone TorD [Vibrio sp. UCD-FRSSP16_30]
MQELKQFNEQRAEIYWWFSSLFSKELTEDDLAAYQSPDVRGFLAGLAENSELTQAVNRLVDALNRLLDRNDAQLELSADFCDLFLTSDKYAALPYASIYLDESKLLNGKPAQAMTALMLDKGIVIDKSFNEPADHLAIELDFLGNLIIRSNQLETEAHLEEAFAEQKAFIEEHLLTWILQFSENCTQYDEFGFYSSVAELLVKFCEIDSHYLTNQK